MKESPPQPPTQPTTKQLTFQLPGGCLGDDKEHYTPHPHTTNPQHNTTKHTNKHSPSETTVGNHVTNAVGYPRGTGYR
ncbi:hypothetical protein ckrop_0846 [Corynebacterium kroppenstedtii DSM 44385]|uniref:Uncharacterized protein n=1 Tax=Corynebacterium kroppenstedtii (strain DSM 44385 / JCM 11950 / CIP 105744 / CCUG 35717) TaxID=645127 RepID=C4LIE5_CORK4|nr:hypothetical protein ckrop_0846 [Corynebacterium kroppenstedtii DSM 44385]